MKRRILVGDWSEAVPTISLLQAAIHTSQRETSDRKQAMLRVMAMYVALYAFIILSCMTADASGGLSIPPLFGFLSTRKVEVAAQAPTIQNSVRTLTVGSQVIPLYYGPLALRGSLAERVRLSEAARLILVPNDNPPFIARLALTQAPAIKKVEDFDAIFNLATSRLPKPMASDNNDDSFGRQRLTIKAMKLRQVGLFESLSPNFQLTNAQLSQICGPLVTWSNIRLLKNLYVEDYSNIAQWNDPNKVDIKYTPNVVGFFCYNRDSKKLLPIEIRLPDTGLAYTPLDTPNEWTLAKMALNAATVAYHQWQHMADTHATTVPIRVELMRNMASEHPVRALLQHHMLMNFGLEMLATVVLFVPGTPHDNQFGWGAAGSALFVDYQLRTSNSLRRDFPTDMSERGLNDIPTHKYAIYGRRLYDAINAFVRSYVNAYYLTDFSVTGDSELQNWAKACAQVPHLKDFPSFLLGKSSLVKLVTHLVFLSAVRHHDMNGLATWHSMVVPYSAPALWKKLPTRKLLPGESINLMEYTVPLSKIHEELGLAATFVRPVKPSQTLPQAYRVEPFASEALLQPAIAAFEASLAAIDAFIVQSESAESIPYDVLRPTSLPFFEWL